MEGSSVYSPSVALPGLLDPKERLQHAPFAIAETRTTVFTRRVPGDSQGGRQRGQAWPALCLTAVALERSKKDRSSAGVLRPSQVVPRACLASLRPARYPADRKSYVAPRAFRAPRAISSTVSRLTAPCTRSVSQDTPATRLWPHTRTRQNRQGSSRSSRNIRKAICTKPPVQDSATAIFRPSALSSRPICIPGTLRSRPWCTILHDLVRSNAHPMAWPTQRIWNRSKARQLAAPSTCLCKWMRIIRANLSGIMPAMAGWVGRIWAR